MQYTYDHRRGKVGWMYKGEYTQLCTWNHDPYFYERILQNRSGRIKLNSDNNSLCCHEGPSGHRTVWNRCSYTTVLVRISCSSEELTRPSSTHTHEAHFARTHFWILMRTCTIWSSHKNPNIHVIYIITLDNSNNILCRSRNRRLIVATVIKTQVSQKSIVLCC